MVHIYIGDGKGKTTAALGLALRALGWKKRVYIAQFLKDIRYPCGEIEAIKSYKLNIKIERFKNQIHPIFLKNKELSLSKIRSSVKNSLSKVESYILNKRFDIIILDEILDALAGGFLPKDALEMIVKKSKGIELILTGRTAPAGLIKKADYVSFLGKIKHPFDSKIAARKGIEY